MRFAQSTALLTFFLLGCATEQKPEFMWTHKDRAEIKHKQEIREKQEAYAAINEIARRKEYVAAHPELTPSVVDAIKSKNVVRGMSEEAVILCWGYPSHRNTTVGRFGKHEQWVYGKVLYGSTYYLYFENGILDSWQTTE